MKQWKVVRITTDTNVLERLLNDGWVVVQATGFGAGSSYHHGGALYVLSREEEE